MKTKYLKYLVLFMIATLSISACGKSDDTDNDRSGRKEIEQEDTDDVSLFNSFNNSDDESDYNKISIKPSSKIINADPADGYYQLYDAIYSKGITDASTRGDGSFSYLEAIGEISMIPLSDLIKSIENEISLHINWIDYNPDRLVPKGDYGFIEGRDDGGNLIYYIHYKNSSDTTADLSECMSYELGHHIPYLRPYFFGDVKRNSYYPEGGSGICSMYTILAESVCLMTNGIMIL